MKVATRCRLGGILLLSILPVAGSAQVWVQHGPGPNTGGQVEGIAQGEVVGAVHTVAAHPTDANIAYLGAVNGGIWRTGNATAANPNWVEQLGGNRSLSIGAIAFDPADATNMTLVAGSGRFSNFSLRPGGDRVGLWRTTDGGTNWNLIAGTIAGRNISGVAARGATLVVSVNASDLAGGTGIWRSTNTGGMWTQISGGAGTGLPAGASFDLAEDPSNNAILFTNAGTLGVFRSVDTGATWEKVSNAMMDALLTAPASLVEITVGTSNNVYVAIVGPSPNDRLTGLFRSGNGGDDWTQLDLPTTPEAGGPFGIHPGTQGNINLSLVADRTNANIAYIGGDRQPRMNDGMAGATFPNTIGALTASGRLFRVDASQAPGSQAVPITHTNTSSTSSPHADSRDMAMDANGDLIESDDGGIYRRTTPLLNTGDWLSMNGDLMVAEFHDAAYDSNSDIIIAGAQDTGTPQQITPGDPEWLSVSTADGGDVAVDDTGTPGMSVRYSSNQNLGSFRRRTYDAANVFLSQVFPARTVVGGGSALVPEFTTPVVLNNVDPLRLIIAGENSVYESMDQANTIVEIGPGIVTNVDGREPIAYGAAGNADILYVGAGDDVFIRDGAPPDPLAASATYPGNGTGRNVAGIAVDPANPAIAFVADTTHVFRTVDTGGMWEDITGNLAALTPGVLLSIAYRTNTPNGSVVVGSFNGVFIARGPDFDLWEPFGTGLPRVPVFDLEYDAVDQVLVAGTMGRGVWSIEERDPVDVSLVLDLSGSMLSPACAGCDSRLQVLKDAVEIFVQLWTVFAIPEDRMGLTYFRTNISEFTPGGEALFPVAANAAAMIADVQGQTTVGANLTAMGGGLQTAINRLDEPARPRSIILFTDGMQNVNPMVDAATLEIADQPGRPPSGVSPTMPPTDLNAALGRKVNTIGVGATPAFVDLLDDIAGDTGGVFKLTTAPDDDLRQFYIEELVDALRNFSPQLVGYRRGTLAGQTATEAFMSNATASRVVLKLSWKRGAKFDFTVEKDGVPLVRAGRFIEGPFYKIFIIDVPAANGGGQSISAAGEWRMRISGSAGAAYEAAAIVDEEELDYDFSIGGANHIAGVPLPLRVELSFGGKPITDANVTARLLTPQIGLGTLLATSPTPSKLSGFAYEPGATDAQRKYQLLLGSDAFQRQLRPAEQTVALQHTGNGVYSATFDRTSFAGPYTAVFDVAGKRADIGTYARTERRTVNVRFGRAILEASNLRLVAVERTRGTRVYDLHVRPVDAAGNVLGPDYGDRLAVLVNGTRVAGQPRDLLDGTYVFTIAVPEPAGDAQIVVTVFDEPLYDGKVANMAISGGRNFALSAHLGATFPTHGFPGHADDGFLAEVDLEYRATPLFSVEGVAGLYDFGSAGSISGFTLYGKWYAPAAAWRWYGALGVGGFRPEGGSAELGGSLAGGLDYPINSRTEFDAGAVYTRANDVGWLGLRVGVKVSF